MRKVHLQSRNDFAEWRTAARTLLSDGVLPERVIWADPTMPADLLAMMDDAADPVVSRPGASVPAGFLDLAETVICHSDPERFSLLYRLLWRLQADRNLLQIASDPDVVRLARMAHAVRRDSHKMTAFVRFKQLPDAQKGRDDFLAWFEPDHYSLERTAPFFQRRFPSMDWGIVTPYRSVFWNGDRLVFGPGGERADVPAGDALEDVWRTYFSSIFNPARLKVKMMKSEMPVRYWRNLPEAEVIGSLIAGAKKAEEEMIEKHASQPPARHLRQAERQPALPTAPGDDFSTLVAVREAAQSCRRCPLYEQATQAVFGEGPEDAEIMFVGEQPGDQEDLAGKPFVGPAGQVFDAALDEAGMDRTRVYVTNAVKHFKFEPRGKKRIHSKPNMGEIKACRFWLDLERSFVRPKIIIAMGASAAAGVLGKAATISALRGEPHRLDDGTTLFVTVHPSYLLRLPDREQAARERELFVQDLARVGQFAKGLENVGQTRH